MIFCNNFTNSLNRKIISVLRLDFALISYRYFYLCLPQRKQILPLIIPSTKKIAKKITFFKITTSECFCSQFEARNIMRLLIRSEEN